MRRNRTERAEYGDFQTPQKLAETVCRLLAESVPYAATIIEPTCGVGNFLFAALKSFPGAQRAIGADINPQYIAKARQRAELESQPIELVQADFFAAEWPRTLLDCAEPILVVGNPPWVTNTHLSKLGSDNTPQKSNESGLSGYEAISGKSNFDISEWMLVRLLDWLNGRNAVLAMLCKTTVARKVLAYAWRSGIQLQSASMRLFDAQESFGVSVDACLLVCTLAPGSCCDTCAVFPSLSERNAASKIGYQDGNLVADVDKYMRWRGLSGPELYRWRSGVKHDCSAVMELRPLGSIYINGLHEKVEIEPDCLFPLFKSSDIANGRIVKPKRYVLVTQTKVGEDTRAIERFAPKTWSYLQTHASRLDSRRSTIYAKQPRFAVFGIGDYSFAPWKVAVSGLYKRLAFHVIPSFEGKPSMLDDTCYFLSCDSEEEAAYLKSLLDSDPAREFYSSFLFPDSKRPVTVDLLRRLDLLALAHILGSEAQLVDFLQRRETGGKYGTEPSALQPVLFG
ncbi:MAG: class I SAM-dependent methyltransferase [Armatimonadota bacterium]|nr:class I SAM-dependent methyltransferase [Armatimonadota bacterium]